jgi:hypothetical protein
MEPSTHQTVCAHVSAPVTAVYLGNNKMIQIVTVHMRFDSLTDMSTNNYKACVIVDGMLVAIKGDITIEAFDVHMEKRWVMKKFDLDGFLNNQFHANLVFNTMTMCMDVRLVEIMKGHLPLEMDKPDSFYPKTPFHPDLMKLSINLPLLATVKAKTAHRLGCQRMYVVVQVYYPAQFAVFFVARFSSAPSDLYSVPPLLASSSLSHEAHWVDSRWSR